MGAGGLETRGKVRPDLFFPTFCQVLGQCGIATSRIKDCEDLERELKIPFEVPIVLISLINEVHDDLEKYNIPKALLGRVNAIFNSNQTAEIIRDKYKTNDVLSSEDILMPSLELKAGKKIFSNARVGSGEEVSIFDDIEKVDDGRYNTEFIDTRIQFEDSVYFTCIRLVCVGTHMLQVYVRARDIDENNPSVQR